MFQISNLPIQTDLCREAMVHSAAGAYVSFEGWVRDHNEGRTVLALEYEAYEALAHREGMRILEEAKSRFEILDAHCAHRVGQLTIGEMAVWVGVTAAHRQAAFGACEYVINQVKHRLPIWKKETYINGDSGWVNCQHCAEAVSMTQNEQDIREQSVLLSEMDVVEKHSHEQDAAHCNVNTKFSNIPCVSGEFLTDNMPASTKGI